MVNSSKQNGAVHPWHQFKMVPGVDGTILVAEVAGAGQQAGDAALIA